MYHNYNSYSLFYYLFCDLEKTRVVSTAMTMVDQEISTNSPPKNSTHPPTPLHHQHLIIPSMIYPHMLVGRWGWEVYSMLHCCLVIVIISVFLAILPTVIACTFCLQAVLDQVHGFSPISRIPAVLF